MAGLTAAEPNSARSPDANVEVHVSPRAVRRTLLAIIAALTVASLVAQVFKYPLDTPYGRGLVPLFDSDAEGNIPTLYSALTLLACALMTGAIALSARGAEHRYARHWTGLSVIFFLATLDESVGLHEVANDWLSDALDPGGLLFYIWVIPALLFVVAVAFAYRPFVGHLPERVRSLATRGALVFVVAALGLEMIEGAMVDSHGGKGSFANGLLSAGQEFLEMVGVLLFIEALITYMAICGQTVTLDFRRPRQAGGNPNGGQ